MWSQEPPAMVCKLHVEALQCSFGRRSDTETLDEASDWLNTILQAVDIIDHKYDDDVVLQKRWWYFPTKVCWQSENGGISNLVQLPSFEQLAVGKSAWGNYSATDEQSSSQRPKLSTLTISCVTIVTSSKQLHILSAQSAHVAFEGLTQFSQSSLESGLF